MRWILAFCLVFFALSFAWHAGHARNDECAADPNIQITVNPLFGNTVYDFSYDIPAIQLMANDAVHRVRQGWAIGLTRYEPVLEMDAPMSVTSTSDGLFCARPASIAITVGTKDMTVSIPSELSGDSCGFEEILHHENEHIAISREIVKKYLPLIREKIDAELRFNGNNREKTAADAVALQKNMLRGMLAGIGEQMSEETSARQQDIDSPKEYHRLLNACNGELAELVKSVRNEQIVAQGF